ncbi:hypothetical protein BMS3Bbin15_00543 [archaeon BMS3Bbin15]|nr:hypothetical protein BMS3Bbin15_00543 [archaeon BMS3Bbin15]
MILPFAISLQDIITGAIAILIYLLKRIVEDESRSIKQELKQINISINQNIQNQNQNMSIYHLPERITTITETSEKMEKLEERIKRLEEDKRP